MNLHRTFALMSCAAVLMLAGCDKANPVSSSLRQTKFPGQVSAGGGTSGEVLARNAKPQVDGSYTGGTPFHAGGAGGNTGGTATGGTVQESGKGQSGSPNPSPPASAPRVEPVAK
jgi:hypothetical protein